MALTWQDLFTKGTLISFNRHLWRAGLRVKAVDLGIDSTQEVRQALSLGQHKLAPSSSFEDINAAIGEWNKAIEEHSFEFPLLKSVRYVPDSEVEPLQQKLNDRRENFKKKVKEFIVKYDQTRREQFPVLEQCLKEVAKTEEAAQTALARINAEYPSQEEVESKFGLEWDFFTITIPASKEAANAAKDAAGQVQSVISSMVEQLRSELSQKVATLIDLAKKAQDGKSRAKEGIGPASKESAFTVLDKVERMNVLGDAVLTEQVNKLRAILKSEFTPDSVVKDLGSIKLNLESDIASASAAAEKKLTGLGNRKLQF